GDPAHSRLVFMPTAWLFEGEVNAETGKRKSPLLRNLVVTDRDLVNDASIGPGDVSMSLRYRDLRHSRLDRSDLKQADLRGADLTGASLEGTDLTGARR
ncbi:MAG: pentapeptide repeat-containing protein, partial [Hyphomicrobiales bacterium]|nr:pentapeptide repeat-containing protein [Hyphomicrobiales bacterium]